MEDKSSIAGLRRSPGGGHGTLFQGSSLENPHGQRSLEGYSPLGHKESDRTGQSTLSFNLGPRIFKIMVKKVQLTVTDWSSDFKNPQCSVVAHAVLDTSAPI